MLNVAIIMVAESKKAAVSLYGRKNWIIILYFFSVSLMQLPDSCILSLWEQHWGLLAELQEMERWRKKRPWQCNEHFWV